MRDVVGNEWMTLDGVVQAPGHADEDRDGGFEHGGRLFGRRTYENLAAHSGRVGTAR